MSLRPLRASLDSWSPQAGRPKDPIHALAAAWRSIVGDDVAANSQPVAFNGDSLVIATRSSAWSAQLQFLSPAILAGIGAYGVPASVRRIAFRSGAFREPSKTRVPGPRPTATRPAPGPYEPAADLADAFERVRRRIRSARHAATVTCASCGAPREPEAPGTECTPCRIDAGAGRTLALQRLIYAAPWLSYEEIRQTLPRATEAAYEHARRVLLTRWWVTLERARASGKNGLPAFERSLASSYVLLQSRLTPDRITPAIVRNLLGDELAAAIFGESPKA